jgi:hypothetical protein
MSLLLLLLLLLRRNPFMCNANILLFVLVCFIYNCILHAVRSLLHLKLLLQLLLHVILSLLLLSLRSHAPKGGGH